MRSSIPKRRDGRRPLATLSALGLAMLVFAGCDDDNVVAVDDGPPAVPTGVYTITGDEWVEVRWNPVYEADVAGYGVYRSATADGTYERLATLRDPEADTYVDTQVTNGFTYFYAVDAFDRRGHESDLSYELAFDTPRPDSEAGGEATGPVTVYARQIDITRAGLDLSSYDVPGGFVVRADDAAADLIFQRVNGLLYAVGTTIGTSPNDIQDLGWTSSMDDVTWAPELGWSVSPDGVELIEGHTYVVWTHNLHFAKFRVVNLNDPMDPSSALLDWAYQTDPENPELGAYLTRQQKDRAPEGRVS